MRARRAIRPILVFGVAGGLLSIAIAIAAAALRPTDGWPNVLGTGRDQYTEKYKLPQFRFRSPDGDVFVDILGGWAHTECKLAPVWRRTIRAGDEWLYTTYPYPESVAAQTMQVFGNPTRFEIPYWASRWSSDPRERAINTSAWGWPFRCLRGTQRGTYDETDDGQVVNHTVQTTAIYVRGSGAVGTRFREVPFGVILPGLLANAALFGVLLWLGWTGAGSLRNRLRQDRHRCPRCGYDRRGLPPGSPCPECGHPLTGA